MEHIKEMLSDNENIRQKLFKFDFDIVGGITKKCISCNKNNKIMDNYGVMCQTKECYKYVSADDYNVLYNKAKLLSRFFTISYGYIHFIRSIYERIFILFFSKYSFSAL